jgi:hypothetical protein
MNTFCHDQVVVEFVPEDSDRWSHAGTHRRQEVAAEEFLLDVHRQAELALGVGGQVKIQLSDNLKVPLASAGSGPDEIWDLLRWICKILLLTDSRKIAVAPRSTSHGQSGESPRAGNQAAMIFLESVLGKRSDMFRNLENQSVRFVNSETLSLARSAGNRLELGHFINKKPLLFPRERVICQLRRTEQRILELKDKGSDTCVVVGNGPSLSRTPLELLPGHDVFISNFAVKAPALLSSAKMLAVTNAYVAEQGRFHFSLCQDLDIFVPFWLSYVFAGDNAYYLNAVRNSASFSRNVAEFISWNATVTHFMLQICYSIGYKRVLLIGVDNSYKQPPTAKEGDVISQQQDDENHFISDYFKGLKWQAADTQHMKSMYELAKSTFEADGREIINCGVGGSLDVFRRSSLESELGAPGTFSKVIHPAKAALKKAVIIGNCQSGPLASLLGRSPDFASSYAVRHFPPVHLISKSEVEELHQELAGASLLVTQPITSNYRGGLGLGTEDLKRLVPRSADVFVWPSLYWEGYNPELFYLRDQKRLPVTVPFDYHHKLILRAFLSGLSEAEAVDYIANPASFSCEFSYAQASLEELRRREESLDLKVVAFIEQTFRTKRLFFTFNHPSVTILHHIAAQILQAVGKGDAAPLNPSFEPLNSTRYPILPTVHTALGLKLPHDSSICIKNKIQTAVEVVREYYFFYSNNPALVELNKQVVADNRIVAP